MEISLLKSPPGLCQLMRSFGALTVLFSFSYLFTSVLSNAFYFNSPSSKETLFSFRKLNDLSKHLKEKAADGFDVP